MRKKFKELSAEELRKIILRKDDNFRELNALYKIEKRRADLLKERCTELEHTIYDLKITVNQDEVYIEKYKVKLRKIFRKISKCKFSIFLLVIFLISLAAVMMLS